MNKLLAVTLVGVASVSCTITLRPVSHDHSGLYQTYVASYDAQTSSTTYGAQFREASFEGQTVTVKKGTLELDNKEMVVDEKEESLALASDSKTASFSIINALGGGKWYAEVDENSRYGAENTTELAFRFNVVLTQNRNSVEYHAVTLPTPLVFAEDFKDGKQISRKEPFKLALSVFKGATDERQCILTSLSADGAQKQVTASEDNNACEFSSEKLAELPVGEVEFAIRIKNESIYEKTRSIGEWISPRVKLNLVD